MENETTFFKLSEDESSKGTLYKCVVCRNSVAFQGLPPRLPICKDCLDALKEIVEEHKRNKEKPKMKLLKVRAGVRYFEDGEVNGGNDITYEAQEQGVKPLMPCVEGENWFLDIDAETGVITNWPKGTTAHVHYKVCDCCGIEYFVDGNKVCDNES